MAETVAVSDPTALEESLGCGRLTFALNRHGEIGMISRSGGDSVDLSLIQDECLLFAKNQAIKMLDSINVALLKCRGNK